MADNTPEITTQLSIEPTVPEFHFGRVRRAIAGGAVVLASIGIAACGSDSNGERDATATTTSTTHYPETTTTTTPEVCIESWEMTGVEHGDNHRWFSDGIIEIKKATNEEEGRDAVVAWLHGSDKHPGIKHDAALFAAGYNLFNTENDKPEIKAEDLVDSKNCATPLAEQALADLEATLAMAEVSPGAAPADGVNTGTDGNGNVTIAHEAGVHGDETSRKALNVTFETEDGTCTVSILGRCGQIVVTKNCKPPTNIPKGPVEDISKVDDGILPGDGTEASQDHGTPDVPGEGPAGQEPGPDGYLPQEPRPFVPPTTAETTPTTRPSEETTPTTGTQPITKPVPVSTTVPQSNATTPPKPPVGD